jgi:hypothetical protein
MSKLAQSIHRAIDDLKVIKAELETAADPKAPAQEKNRILQDAQAMPMLFELKTLVDHMRHLLWAYMEANAASGHASSRDVEAKLQSVRMQRVTEMLKTLQPDVASPSTAALPEASTFFDLIQDIAHSTVDRHQGPL